MENKTYEVAGLTVTRVAKEDILTNGLTFSANVTGHDALVKKSLLAIEFFNPNMDDEGGDDLFMGTKEEFKTLFPRIRNYDIKGQFTAPKGVKVNPYQAEAFIRESAFELDGHRFDTWVNENESYEPMREDGVDIFIYVEEKYGEEVGEEFYETYWEVI